MSKKEESAKRTESAATPRDSLTRRAERAARSEETPAACRVRELGPVKHRHWRKAIQCETCKASERIEILRVCSTAEGITLGVWTRPPAGWLIAERTVSILELGPLGRDVAARCPRCSADMLGIIEE